MKEPEFYDRVARLSFEDAIGICKEARLSFDHGYHSRSVALSIMSMEEQTKASVCLLVSIGEVKGKDLFLKKEGFLSLFRSRRGRTKTCSSRPQYQAHTLWSALPSDPCRKRGDRKDKGGRNTRRGESFSAELARKRRCGKVFKKMEDTRLNAIYVEVREGKAPRSPRDMFNREETGTYLG